MYRKGLRDSMIDCSVILGAISERTMGRMSRDGGRADVIVV